MKVVLIPDRFKIRDSFPMQLTHFVSKSDYDKLVKDLNSALKPIKKATKSATKAAITCVVLIPFTLGLSVFGLICTAPMYSRGVKTATSRMQTICDEFNAMYRPRGVFIEHEYKILAVTGSGDNTRVHRQHQITLTVPDVYIPPPNAPQQQPHQELPVAAAAVAYPSPPAFSDQEPLKTDADKGKY